MYEKYSKLIAQKHPEWKLEISWARIMVQEAMNRAYPGKFRFVDCSISYRFNWTTRRVGQAHLISRRVEFCAPYFEIATFEQRLQTITHELLHIYHYILYPNAPAHGHHWKQMMAVCGYQGRKNSSLTTSELYEWSLFFCPCGNRKSINPAPKYMFKIHNVKIICSKCGKEMYNSHHRFKHEIAEKIAAQEVKTKEPIKQDRFKKGRVSIEFLTRQMIAGHIFKEEYEADFYERYKDSGRSKEWIDKWMKNRINLVKGKMRKEGKNV